MDARDSGRTKLEHTERFRALQRMYVLAALEDTRELGRILDSARMAPLAGEEGRRFRKIAHNLVGSGGSYEFPEVSERARLVEGAYLEGAEAHALAAALAALEAAVRASAAAVGAEVASDEEGAAAGGEPA